MIALFSKSAKMNCNLVRIVVVFGGIRSVGPFAVYSSLAFMSRWRNFCTHFLSIITQFVLNFSAVLSLSLSLVHSTESSVYIAPAWLCCAKFNVVNTKQLDRLHSKITLYTNYMMHAKFKYFYLYFLLPFYPSLYVVAVIFFFFCFPFTRLKCNSIAKHWIQVYFLFLFFNFILIKVKWCNNVYDQMHSRCACYGYVAVSLSLCMRFYFFLFLSLYLTVSVAVFVFVFAIAVVVVVVCMCFWLPVLSAQKLCFHAYVI